MKSLLIVFSLCLLTGCSSNPLINDLAESVFESITETDVSYNASSCPSIKRKCSSGGYNEWYQKDGKLACACNK